MVRRKPKGSNYIFEKEEENSLIQRRILYERSAIQLREISSMLCDNLEGWDREGGREAQEGGDMGIYVYV